MDDEAPQKMMLPEGIGISLVAAAIEAGARKYCQNVGTADEVTAIRIANFASVLLNEMQSRTVPAKAGRKQD